MASVYLKVVSRQDATDLITANLASKDFHAPWVRPFTDQAGFDQWLHRTVTGPNVGLVARTVDDDDIVGVVNISEIVMGVFQSGYLGYYGTLRFAGQGLMGQALELAMRYGFEKIGLHRLEANIQSENVASIALVKKLGFTKEGVSPSYLKVAGVWRDHERWAMLKG